MKTKLIILAAFISSSLLSQPKPTYISKTKIGVLECSIQRNVWANYGNSDLFVSVAFPYEGFASDIRSISFDMQNDSASIDNFIKDINNAINFLGNNEDMEWGNDSYRIKTFDVSAKVFLFESPKIGDGHTELSKTDAQRLIAWLTGTIKNRAKYIHGQQSGKKVLSSI